MRLALKIFVISSLMLLTQGCPKSVHIQLYNNTGAEVVIHTTAGPVTCAKSSSIVGLSTELNAGYQRQGHLAYQVLSVQCSERLWSYIVPAVGSAYRGGKTQENRPERNLIRLQIDKSGELRVLQSHQEYPLSIDASQPSGFPLRPFATNIVEQISCNSLADSGGS